MDPCTYSVTGYIIGQVIGGAIFAGSVMAGFTVYDWFRFRKIDRDRKICESVGSYRDRWKTGV
jgi:hypothetical protein